MIWCLHVVIAEPCYKRPSVDIRLFHFNSKEAAENKLIEIKKEVMHIYDITDEDIFNDYDRLCELWYGDSYMDIPPFEAHIFEVKIHE